LYGVDFFFKIQCTKMTRRTATTAVGMEIAALRSTDGFGRLGLRFRAPEDDLASGVGDCVEVIRV